MRIPRILSHASTCAVRAACVLACVCVLTPVPSRSQAPEAEAPQCTENSGLDCVDESESRQDDGIVVTGTRTEHAEADAPVPTQVIRREDIEAVATDNIEDLLSQIPDLHVRRNEEFGLGASTIRMQGLDANKTAILIDGHRFRGGVDGVVDLRDISAGGIEQIEIVRGPASSLYGSDAMAGVVNIRTRSGSDKPYLRTEAALGTADRKRVSTSHGYHVGPVRYFLTVQHDAVAIADLYGENISSQYADDHSDDLQTRDSARLRLDGNHGDQQWQFLGDYAHEDNPLSVSDDAAGTFGWKTRLPFDWTLEMDASFYLYDRTNDLEGFAEDVQYLDLGTDSRVTRPLGSFLYADHFFAAGLRIRDEELESAGTTVGNEGFGSDDIRESVREISPYLQTETLIGANWSLVLGVSADHNEHYGFDASPRATLTWRPTDDLRLSATVGRGYRAPDLLQLYDVDINNVVVIGDRVNGYAIAGNEDLEPETDLGTTLFAQYTGLRGMRITADAFRHDLDDGIGFALACTGGVCVPGFENPVPELEGPVFTYENIAAAVTQGVDLTVESNVLTTLGIRAPAHHLRAGIGAGYLDTENRGNIAGEKGKKLPFRPDYRVLPFVEYGYRPSGTSLRLWGELDGPQYTDFVNSDAGKVPSYFSLDIRFRQSIGAAVDLFGYPSNALLRSLHFFVHAENVTGEEVDAGFGPLGPLAMLPKRNVQAGLVWTFGDNRESRNGAMP